MRGGMDNLAKPEAGGEEGEDTLRNGQAGGADDGPGRNRQEDKRAEADGNEEEVGCREFGGFGLAGDERDELVEDQGEAGHVKEGGPEPPTAQG
jgi:hypothetical protein